MSLSLSGDYNLNHFYGYLNQTIAGQTGQARESTANLSKEELQTAASVLNQLADRYISDGVAGNESYAVQFRAYANMATLLTHENSLGDDGVLTFAEAQAIAQDESISDPEIRQHNTER